MRHEVETGGVDSEPPEVGPDVDPSSLSGGPDRRGLGRSVPDPVEPVFRLESPLLSRGTPGCRPRPQPRPLRVREGVLLGLSTGGRDTVHGCRPSPPLPVPVRPNVTTRLG